MKKKLIAALMCVAMVASLAACGSSSSSTTTEETTEEETTEDEEEAAEEEAEEVAEAVEEVSGDIDYSSLNVAVFYYTYSDTYVSSVRTALDAIWEENGVTYQNYDGNNNQTTQNEQIDTAINTGANMLIVNIVTASNNDVTQNIVDKASAADLPIVFFNKTIEAEGTEGEILSTYDKLAFVGTDAPEAGHIQGQMIGEYLVENYDAVDLNGDGVISYALMMGELGNSEAIYRSQYGVEDANEVLVAAGYPELEYFDSSNTDKYQVDQDGAWSATAANNYMTTNLSQYSEANGNMIELVICNNDSMAEGVISALQDKGYNLGSDEDCTTIPVFGVDATDAAKQLIADGCMTGTVKQDAEGMAEAIAYLVSNIAQGNDLTADTDDYNKDTENGLDNKIYIPYEAYTGE